MANSCTRNPFGFNPFEMATRTPGSLGYNDAGAPDSPFWFMGDTPGVLGVKDHGDPEVVAKNQKGSIAMPTNNAAVEYISLEQAQEMALSITTYFEGGKSMNYQALADDFDGQGTSFGLIQWNFGQNTLGPLLKKMLDSNPAAFAACFGPEADYDALKAALVSGKNADQLKWARCLIKNKRSTWEAAFKKIGSNETFNKIQQQHAAGHYHPKALSVIKDIRNICSNLFANIEFRSYASIFDLCVQQGSVQKALGKIKIRVANEKPMSQLDLMKIVVTERGRTASSAWVTDCISRRIGILMGASYISREGGSVKERKNPLYCLIGQFGVKCVLGL